jgi:septal ring factor EnvC (AmiA/AmiB activator)
MGMTENEIDATLQSMNDQINEQNAELSHLRDRLSQGERLVSRLKTLLAAYAPSHDHCRHVIDVANKWLQGETNNGK